MQLHVEHRLVRRLLSRFISPGLPGRACRAQRYFPAGGQARVVLVGRLALYGPGAARLHEEIIPVTASGPKRRANAAGSSAWRRRRRRPRLTQLEEALRDANMPPAELVKRLLAGGSEGRRRSALGFEERARASAENAKSELAKIANAARPRH